MDSRLRGNDTSIRIRPLTIDDLIKDYDAVMDSVEHLKGLLEPAERLAGGTDPRGTDIPRHMARLPTPMSGYPAASRQWQRIGALVP